MAMWLARGFCRAPGCHELAYEQHFCERHYGELTEKWQASAARQASSATVDGWLECAGCGQEYPLADLVSQEGGMVCRSCSNELTDTYIEEMQAEYDAYGNDDDSDEEEEEYDEEYDE